MPFCRVNIGTSRFRSDMSSSLCDHKRQPMTDVCRQTATFWLLLGIRFVGLLCDGCSLSSWPFQFQADFRSLLLGLALDRVLPVRSGRACLRAGILARQGVGRGEGDFWCWTRGRGRRCPSFTLDRRWRCCLDCMDQCRRRGVQEEEGIYLSFWPNHESREPLWLTSRVVWRSQCRRQTPQATSKAFAGEESGLSVCQYGRDYVQTRASRVDVLP